MNVKKKKKKKAVKENLHPFATMHDVPGAQSAIPSSKKPGHAG